MIVEEPVERSARPIGSFYIAQMSQLKGRRRTVCLQRNNETAEIGQGPTVFHGPLDNFRYAHFHSNSVVVAAVYNDKCNLTATIWSAQVASLCAAFCLIPISGP